MVVFSFLYLKHIILYFLNVLKNVDTKTFKYQWCSVIFIVYGVHYNLLTQWRRVEITNYPFNNLRANKNDIFITNFIYYINCCFSMLYLLICILFYFL